MGLVTYKIQQGDRAPRGHRQPYVLRAEPFLQLRQEPVNRQRDDEKEIETKKGEDIAHGVADLSDEPAEEHPQGSVVGHHRGRADVSQGPFEIVCYGDGYFAHHVAVHVPDAADHVGDGVYEAVGDHLRHQKRACLVGN